MGRAPKRYYRKKAIPKAVREAVWVKYARNEFEIKCQTTWCPNRITAFTFQAGHNVPEVRGGATDVSNLVPICSRCNQSMGSQYTFDEWCKQFQTPTHTSSFSRWLHTPWRWLNPCLCPTRLATTTVVPEPVTCCTRPPIQ